LNTFRLIFVKIACTDLILKDIFSNSWILFSEIITSVIIFHTCTFWPKEITEKITKNSPDCQNLTVFRDKSILGRRRKWI